jgi:hypothetical protein
MTDTYCCVYSVETPDDEQWTCPKHVEFFVEIKRYSFCLMAEASDHGYVLHTRRIYVFSINGG